MFFFSRELSARRGLASFVLRYLAALVAIISGYFLGPLQQVRAVEPIQVGFLWHMHQPIYFPGETLTQTDAAGHFSFSPVDVHNQRQGPYTSWPLNAIQAGSHLPNLGASVSFSGSLIQNLNQLEATGANGGSWSQWESSYNQAQSLTTAEGNPRLDLIGFGHHHPLGPLLDTRDLRMQIRLHKYTYEQTWGNDVPYSKGYFPAETAFSSRMIPALVAEGIEWTLYDNIHLDRATQNYPHTNASNLYAPNRADQINPDPTTNGGAWVQLNNLWAPSQVSAPFSYRPHHVQHIDPNTGSVQKLVGVPAARYEGNEDGRGGYGAFLYDQVMDQYLPYNTDPDHPMLVVLHHDGDNFGGGSEGYYNGNFQNMVNWVQNDPDYNVTVIQDYLDKHPVDPNDVVHVEPGSWAGADNGDPEFKKWLGDPDASGWSPDRNSWAVLTAAKNRVFTAHDLTLGGPDAFPNMQEVYQGTGGPVSKSWHYLLQAQASDHWYWDGTEVWDSNVTRGSNLAVAHADQVLNSSSAAETTPPTLLHPQRESYNPGGFEFGNTREPSDFEVWTYAYDVSELSSVTLKYRIDGDGFNPLDSTHNETYAGGAEVGDWISVSMNSSDVQPPGNITSPTYRALRYGGMIEGLEDVLVDYYVEAVDGLGNVARSDIQHVYIGDSSIGTDPTQVIVSPDPLVAGESALIQYDPAGGPLGDAQVIELHFGFDDWQEVSPSRLPLTYDASSEMWNVSVPLSETASQFDFVFTDGQNTWDNNKGADWHLPITGAQGPAFVMDGTLDSVAETLAEAGGNHLYASVNGSLLYVATEDAGEGQDVFIYLARDPGDLQPANWAKASEVAGWDAFLADENDNDYEGWFDAASVVQIASGNGDGVLEGVIDLLAEFGEMPEEIYLAVGRYETGDGGQLVWSLQTPASANSDGNLDASEFYRFVLSVLVGDFDGDGNIDSNDLTQWQLAYSETSGADANDDGIVDGFDFLAWQAAVGANSQSSLAARTVPEPAGSLHFLLGVVAASLARNRKAVGRLLQ
ncbi:MAG: carbohydrate-binding protein [Lacipirellulaceae bacterium]